jgi:hypothetical protein
MGAFTDEAEMTMRSTASIRPVNSLLFISDTDGGSPPTPIRGPMILSTPSCISVRCYPEQDGPTEVVLGDAEDVELGHQPAFEGELETPHRAVVISTVVRETVLEVRVTETRTRVQVWLNHPRWPDKVTIGLGYRRQNSR